MDKAVQLDQKLLTSRKPGDLPGFCAKLVELLEAAIDERRLDKMVEQSFPASDPRSLWGSEMKPCDEGAALRRKVLDRLQSTT